MSNLIIDPEFKSLIPPLAPDEYQQLEQNILNDGCLHELIVWNGTIVDGHNRYEICQKHSIPFKVRNWHFDSRDDAKEWIIRNQFGRRNISDYQRSVLALRLKEIIAARAKENQGVRTDLTSVRNLTNVDTKKEIAKAAGVSHDTIHKVEKIEKEAPEPIKELAKTGDVSINKAYEATKIINQLPEQEKAKVIELVEEKGKPVVDEVVKRLNVIPSLAEKMKTMSEPELRDTIKKLEEIDKKDKEEDARIEFVYRIKRVFTDAIEKPAQLRIDQEKIEAYLENETREEIEYKIDRINDAVNNLTKLQNALRDSISRPKLVKGGR